mmetsp:Transcript_59000/g.118003  ORF Transcript_59000/g.118003 Transcript_59000/m.118003 type:complete len:180 (-) Transcript_59000:271-810(-)
MGGCTSSAKRASQAPSQPAGAPASGAAPEKTLLVSRARQAEQQQKSHAAGAVKAAAALTGAELEQAPEAAQGGAPAELGREEDLRKRAADLLAGAAQSGLLSTAFKEIQQTEMEKEEGPLPLIPTYTMRKPGTNQRISAELDEAMPDGSPIMAADFFLESTPHLNARAGRGLLHSCWCA